MQNVLKTFYGGSIDQAVSAHFTGEGDDLDEWVYKKEYYFVKEWFSDLPSDLPSSIPSDVPSMIPSDMPSMIPSDAPSSVPSQIPTTPLVRRRD